MHSLQGQNVFLPSCGPKSRVIQDCSINSSCEDVRLGTVSPDERFFLYFSTAGVLDCCSGSWK